MKIKIKITKDILKKSMLCGIGINHNVKTDCAIAFALREIAPNASVTDLNIFWTGEMNYQDPVSPLPTGAGEFIRKFDSLSYAPGLRLYLPVFSFEIEFPDKLIERIGIGEIKNILSNSETISEV